MKPYLKSLGIALIITVMTGAQSLYACATCGCSGSAPKAEAKKMAACCAAAKAAGTECKICIAKKAADPACPSGVCSLSSAPKADAAHGHNINTFQLKAHVDSGDAILLDARAGKYDDGYRIPGAKSLNSKSTAEEIAKVIPNKGAQIVTYCSNLQCPASKALAEHLKALGYTHVHEYPEGIASWRAAGGRVEKVK